MVLSSVCDAGFRMTAVYITTVHITTVHVCILGCISHIPHIPPQAQLRGALRAVLEPIYLQDITKSLGLEV